MNKDFSKLATYEQLQRTIEALKVNGMSAEVVATSAEAKEKALALIPEGSEVFAKTSVTTKSIGLTEIIDESGKYKSVRKELNSMDRATQGRQMQKLGAAPDYLVGSVHAVTEDGHVFIASNTGSQLPADASGAGQVIWIVGTQKIVANDEEAYARVYEYVLPKETVRARAAYGLDETFHSNVSKLLIINKEVNPTRIHIIFVKEALGF